MRKINFFQEYQGNIKKEPDFLVINSPKSGVKYVNAYYPLYFATVLKKNGLNAAYFNEDSLPETSIEFTEQDNVRVFLEIIKKFKPKYLFIYATVLNIPFVIELVNKVKKNFLHIKQILFGSTFFYLPRSNFKFFKNADFIFDGLYEYDIKNLVKFIKNGKLFGQSVYSDLIGLKSKISESDSNIFANYNIMINCDPPKRFAIKTNRGCKYSCNFCPETEKKLYLKNPEKTVNYIKYLKNKFGIEDFVIMDSSVTSDRDWLEKFCNLLIRKKVSIKWNALSRIDTVDDGILKLIKEAGCYYLSYGLESLNERTLKFFNKAKDIKKYINAALKNIELTIKNNIYARVLLLTGVPVESEKEINNTARLARSLRNSGAGVKIDILYAWPGTVFWQQCKIGELELIRIKNEKLKNFVGDLSGGPPLFYDKYRDFPDIAPSNWIFKNEKIPDDYLEELIYEKFHEFNPSNHRQNKSYFERIDLPEGEFNITKKTDFPLKRIDVFAAPKTVKNYEAYISGDLYINGKIANNFKLKNNLNFSKIRMNLKETLEPGEHSFAVRSKNGDNNIFVRCADIIGEESIYTYKGN